MHRIDLHYTLRPREAAATRQDLHHPLMHLLQAVAEQGSISAAARASGLSYRHVWGELKRWEAQLGETLVVWSKGQSAHLSEFGQKLLWAERQTQARLAPQIDALRADLERTFAVAFDPSAHVLPLYASHDDALPLLRDWVAPQGLHLELRFCGSVDAIGALNEGRCTLAGFHCLHQPDRDSLTARSYRERLQPGHHKLIGFATRSQGLLVAPGNPLGLKGLADAVTQRARFARRSLGTGTRVLLEDLLRPLGCSSEDLHLHGADEPSHSAVALAIRSGAADVGLGLASVAQVHGLGFVPLVEEQYHLVCLKSALETPPLQALRKHLQSPDWARTLGSLAGYAPVASGAVRPLKGELPWWTFRRPK